MRQTAPLRATAIVGPAILIAAGGVVAFASTSTSARILTAFLLTAGAVLAAYVAVTLTQALERRLAEQETAGTQMRESAALAEHARVALTTERRFLRQVIDINPNFVFAKDRQGRFTLVNQAVADVYGTSIEQLIGKSDADFNSNEAEVRGAYYGRVGTYPLAPDGQMSDHRRQWSGRAGARRFH
jgi:PAS domain-containing protein